MRSMRGFSDGMLSGYTETSRLKEEQSAVRRIALLKTKKEACRMTLVGELGGDLTSSSSCTPEAHCLPPPSALHEREWCCILFCTVKTST